MTTPPSIPGVDRDDLAYAIWRKLPLTNEKAHHAADVVLAHIADHHQCAPPATWDDGGARPVEGEHGWVTPLLPDGSQRFPDGTPVEAWHPGYGDGLRSLYYVEGGKYTDVLRRGAISISVTWHEGTLIRPALPPTAAACDREHDDEWVEVDEDTWRDLPDGMRLREEWVSGDAVTSNRLFVHRDDLPDPDPDPRTLISRHLGAEQANTFLSWLDKNGWTVTRKEDGR